ncbi:putative ABC bile acid transporter [Phyllosticta citrichinensis]|uniref:ABC bile acid transporter n=1 Tax=Phyllosticta citrichinensis TaxID=1130410 RepID=A0ABR1Y114_9PEZI
MTPLGDANAPPDLLFSTQQQQTPFQSVQSSGSSSGFSPKLPLATATAALALLSLNATISIVQTLRLRRRGSKLETAPPDARAVAAGKAAYADADGVATPDAVARYGCALKVRLALLAGVAAAGFAVAVARAVVGVLEHREKGLLCVVQWVAAGLWLPLNIQAIELSVEKEPVRRYNLAINNAATYLISLAIYCYVDDFRTLPKSLLGLSIARVALALVGLILSTLVPRRPHVEYKGRPVDTARSSSAFSRHTYGWLTPLLSFASKQGFLNQTDLPTLDSHARCRDLHDAFVASKYTGRLWKNIVRAHLSAFITQYIVAALSGITFMAPQFAMYKLLQLLEARDAGADVTVAASLWVVGLGVAVLVDNHMDNWRWWLSYGSLNVPIRVQLSALIFAKSMRRKETKGVRKDADEEKEDADGEKGDGEDEDALKQTQQGTINLVGVDSKRIADFSTYQAVVWSAVIKLTLAFIFIYKLVGWEALLAGIAAQICVLPLNSYFARRYASAQNDLMSARDKKLAVLNEALTGIRQIKFSALEQQWQKKIQEYRETELKIVWRVFVSDTFLIFCWIFGPYMLSAVTLAVHALVYKHLYPSIAFTTIGILGQIEGTLAFVPEIIAMGIDSWVSVKRIEEYLNAPEKPSNTIPGDEISFKHANIAWPSDSEKNEESFVLRDLDFTFPTGKLSVISGRTGSGKTLLLKAILGEVDVLSGSIVVPQALPVEKRYDHKANRSNWIIPSTIAFVSQQPWIENHTFRDNILFGLPFDETRYNKVIQACALDPDLKLLSDGDNTEIGAQGINLSGGQKWRITLARALYSRAGILLMDDIFSAVDAHVGRHIFEHALTGELGYGRTRIVVTHHFSLCLPRTNFEVLLSEGQVERSGLVADLRENGGLDEILEEERIEDEFTDESPLLDGGNGYMSPRRRRSSAIRRGSLSAALENGNGIGRVRRASRVSERSALIDDGGHMHVDSGPRDAPKRFTEEETKMKGKVLLSVYRHYIKAGGGYWFWAGVVLAFCVIQALILGRSWWLTIWTGQYKTQEASTGFVARLLQHPVRTPYHSQALTRDTNFYVGVYMLISVSISLFGTIRYYIVFCGSIRASRKLFDDLVYAVLRAPMRWLDTVPTGRILNRFTADFSAIDMEQASGFSFMLFHMLLVVGIIVAGMMVTPVMILFAVILLALCLRYALFYLVGARETKRLESLAKSPMFELFGASLSGLSTIRAFGKTADYIENMFDLIDRHGQTIYYMWAFNRWLTYRLGVIGAVFSLSMATLIVSLRSIDAALAGFALGFTLEYSMAVVWMLRQYAIVELAMNAVERVIEYSSGIETEDQGGAPAPAAWPSEGRLEVDNLVVSYAADLAPVLKGVSFSVRPNERVGVVGRTGAGKSSLTLALFRFLEAREGSIHIDGLDIAALRLHDVRSRLAIIPQDPVLFSGTVRSNLDPFNEHTDAELREALQRVHLVSPADYACASSNSGSGNGSAAEQTNTNPFASLSTTISEGGANLSQGQRQLLCLARAIIARPKIMMLDEATSAVDKATDERIQRSVREQFDNSTLLVIAHRLSTIVDFDRILVLGEGRVVEFGTPLELMMKEEGVFKGMVRDSGERGVLESVIFGTVEEEGEGGGDEELVA